MSRRYPETGSLSELLRLSPPDDKARPEYAPTQSFVGAVVATPRPASHQSPQGGPVGLRAGLRIGQYRIVRELGRGGMGLVYEAQHERIGQRVAVKVLSADPSLRPDSVQRFLTEARAAIIAEHPGLVKIFDHGQLPSGELYILMEYLEGETLADRLARTPQLPLAQVLRLTRQTAVAMAAAHERGIVHRGR
jgi:serine/threonine-protein kinase